MKKPKNILRYEHHNFTGWQVSVCRNRVRYQRYISDNTAGGKQKALRAAIKLRDELIASLPTSHPRASSRNSSGVLGVYVLRRGRKLVGYGASWHSSDGTRIRKAYSVSRWGEKKARALAAHARSVASAEVGRAPSA